MRKHKKKRPLKNVALKLAVISALLELVNNLLEIIKNLLNK